MDLEARAGAAGVDLGYHDYTGEFRRSPESSLLKVLEAIEGAGSPGPEPPGPLVLRRGSALPFGGPALIDTDTGDEISVEGTVPADMPFGYHTIRGRDAIPRRLIVGPGACYLPDDLRVWGWAAQLYSLRSGRSWGMGDLEDLEGLARWSASEGAALIMVNPLGAATPGRPIEPSPYYPSSRSFRNPLYLSVDSLAGNAPGLESLRTTGRALNTEPLLNRDAVWAAKGPALELLYNRFGSHPEFDRFCRDQGRPLDDFATFCALAEQFDGPSREWPEGLSRPGTPEVEVFRSENCARVRFHKWLQWQLENQLTRAGGHLGLLQDLPVGVDPGGADVWVWGDAFATEFELGAPPDDFNRDGQCWGIAGFHPRRLRAAQYEPFIQMIRSTFAHSGGIRIDHVMGLFRLFWIPQGSSPAEGVYVRYPAGDLLDIVALESLRAKALVVGEDLGTVEPHVREEMAARSILSYRLLIFEEGVGAIPQDSMAAVTTHDLPTLAGIWDHAPDRSSQAPGQPANDDGIKQMRAKLEAVAGLGPEAPVGEVIPEVYRRLGATAARIVLATLEDAVAATERPNMPGVSEGWPNWKIPLPKTLEEIVELGEACGVVGALTSSRRPPGDPQVER